MTTAEVRAMLDSAWGHNFVAYVALGGEPMLREDTPEILVHAKAKGFYTSLITNGTRLTEEAARLVPNTDLIWVSLDHDSSLHDEMRGLDGAYEAAIAGIEEVRSLGGRARINCVLSAMNPDAPERMARLAARLGVRIAYDPMEVFPSNEQYALTPEARVAAFKKVRRLKLKGYPILNSHDFIEQQLSPKRYKCSQPRVFLKVEEDGSIHPFWCPSAENFSWSLRKQGLGEVISSPEWKRFAELAEGCSRCTNSSTYECSVFYDAQRFAKNFYKPKNPYFRFIEEFGYR
jgi:MoaA/NifB/PqqE/SkfB family radical SAM enzyme